MRLSGEDVYLGRYGTPASHAAYAREIAEWLARGRTPKPAGAPLTVAELVEQRRARRGRSPVSDQAFAHLLPLYGPTPAAAFSQARLRAVQEAMVAAGVARTNINRLVTAIVGLFKFASGRELVPSTVAQGLRDVEPLLRGQTKAVESAPVKPVDVDHANAVMRHVPEPVGAMIGLQLITGMRPGEVVIMRGCDLETDPNGGLIWTYRPAHHKTAHLGHARTVVLGPEAQKIVKVFLKPDLSAFLFQPPPRGKRKTGPRYSVATYRQAIARGCVKAGCPHWHPHQLRHTAATLLRQRYGVETAQAVLGHKSIMATQIYAERNDQLARRVAAERG